MPAVVGGLECWNAENVWEESDKTSKVPGSHCDLWLPAEAQSLSCATKRNDCTLKETWRWTSSVYIENYIVKTLIGFGPSLPVSTTLSISEKKSEDETGGILNT